MLSLNFPKLFGAARSSAAGSFGGRGKGAKKVPTRKELLALRPMRNPDLEWSEEDGRIVLHIKHKKMAKAWLLTKLFPIPEDRRVVLDAIGTDVWQLIDGKTNIGRIAKVLAQKYKLTPREMELSLQQFFKELGRRGYIGFWVQEETGKEETAKAEPTKNSKS